MKFNFSDKPALLLIDFQKAFENVNYWGGGRNNREAENKASQLLQIWRDKKLPVFHTQHCSVNPNSPLAENKTGNEFIDILKPIEGESIIKKNVNSGFIGTNLKKQIDDMGIKTIVVAGLTTDHCVSTTVRMAGNYGYNVWLISDATATFDKISIEGEKFSAKLMHDTAIASLNDEFAKVANLSELIL